MSRALTLVLGVTVLLMAGLAGTVSVLDRTDGRIVSAGIERRYLLYVPPNYDASKPTPLVVSLHGVAAWPAQQMHMTHWNEVAAQQRFIVAYPEARGGIWRVQHPGVDPTPDIQFISDLIGALEHRYNIDPMRVYVNGFSLGGAMTFVLSCVLADRLAAVATVSAAQTLPWQSCRDDHPMPLINFHGTADLVPYAGGLSPDPFNRVMFPSVRVWTTLWARRNHCSPAAVDSAVAEDVRATVYHDCANDATVELFTVQGGGHAWPGGKPLPSWFFGRTTTSVNATQLIWAFFQAHARHARR